MYCLLLKVQRQAPLRTEFVALRKASKKGRPVEFLRRTEKSSESQLHLIKWGGVFEIVAPTTGFSAVWFFKLVKITQARMPGTNA